MQFQLESQAHMFLARGGSGWGLVVLPYDGKRVFSCGAGLYDVCTSGQRGHARAFCHFRHRGPDEIQGDCNIARAGKGEG
eukprot:5480437-Lingulodinium_polyedra.AAC.1